MTTNRQATCQERIADHLESRLADLRAMMARPDPDEGDDELPGLYEYPLASDVTYSVRVVLSTGGPADYLTAAVAVDGTVGAIVYHFADWYDHAEVELYSEERDTAEAFIVALYGDDIAYALRSELERGSAR